MFALKNITTKTKNMETQEKTIVTVESLVNAPVEKVWEYWVEPQHITRWNCASDDWHSPRAENDVRTGGNFNIRMEAKDGSMGFDFAGTYDNVKPNEYIEYTLGDGRKVQIAFIAKGKSTQVIESFEAENQHPVEFQKSGWQSILDNFKKYSEANS